MKNIFNFNLKVRKKDLTWKEAKKRFPKLNPFGDIDRDGVKNRFDCRPFDKTRQGWEPHKPQSKEHIERRVQSRDGVGRRNYSHEPIKTPEYIRKKKKIEEEEE